MGQLFDMDLRDIAKFARLSARAPRQFAAATGMILNDAAFGSRDESIDAIESTMLVRKKSLPRVFIRAKKSHFRLPITSQESEVGSLETDRFSGWVEQQRGDKADRSRVFTLVARAGSAARQAKPSARLDPKTDFLEASDFNIQGAKNEDHRQEIFIRMLARRKHRKPFLLRKHSKFAPGLYRMTGTVKRTRIKMLQSFDPKKPQPRRIPWLTIGVENYLRSNRSRMAVKKALKRTFRAWKF